MKILETKKKAREIMCTKKQTKHTHKLYICCDNDYKKHVYGYENVVMDKQEMKIILG